jgi:hypothetical protein
MVGVHFGFVLLPVVIGDNEPAVGIAQLKERILERIWHAGSASGAKV